MPYMLTGEIEVAIIFALPTIGPAIVGSMGIGDVLVTATLMLILGATLIIGNIVADILLAWMDPRIRLGDRSMSDDLFAPFVKPEDERYLDAAPCRRASPRTKAMPRWCGANCAAPSRA